jgi:hypothetical protein
MLGRMPQRPSATVHDPLERIANRRVIVATTVAVAIGAFIGSALGATPSKLPGIALESSLLMHVERSLIVASAVASVLIIVLRGWAGYFPAKLSASGAEYGERSAVTEGVWNEHEILDALADMDAKHLALARSLSEDLERLRCRAAIDGTTDGGDG